MKQVATAVIAIALSIMMAMLLYLWPREDDRVQNRVKDTEKDGKERTEGMEAVTEATAAPEPPVEPVEQVEAPSPMVPSSTSST